MEDGDIQDYRQVIHKNLMCVYMDGKMGGDGYLGMSLDNLHTNIVNMLEDCGDDTEKFKEAVAKVFKV